jgi:competence ComEA-like helix-hairpin-helix protein
MPYTRPQLWLLLALALVFLAGLGVREWRAGFPELAERLEQLDREAPIEPAPALPVPPTPLPAPRPPRRSVAPPSEGTRSSESLIAKPGLPGELSPHAPADPRPLDLNAASIEQIARLPGIGPALAGRIVEERERRGRFESTDALRSVLGLGPKKLAAVKDLLVVPSE